MDQVVPLHVILQKLQGECGSLYEYFKNKEEIYDAMNHYFVSEILDMIKELTPTILELELEPVIEMIFIRSVIY